LVSKTNQNFRFVKLVEKYFGSFKDENDTFNALCLVASKVCGVSICGSLRGILFIEWMANFIEFLMPGPSEWERYDIILQILDFVYFFVFPFRFFSTAIVCNQEPLDFDAKVLWYFSIGLKGIKRGGQWTIMPGFSGIYITMLNKELHWYFGSTLLVGY
jgi:hypothetical protein